MSLTDILSGTGIVAFTAGIFYAIDKYYIPWASKVEKEFDKHPELDGYRIDGKEDKK